jgi:hypothetical protein
MPQRRSDFLSLARTAARTSSTTPRILVYIERIEQQDAEQAEILIQLAQSRKVDLSHHPREAIANRLPQQTV